MPSRSSTGEERVRRIKSTILSSTSGKGSYTDVYNYKVIAPSITECCIRIQKSTIYYSNDGEVWIPATATDNPYDPDRIPFNGLNKITGGACACVTFSGSLWVAGGSGGNTLYYSNDGRVWTPATVSNNPYDPDGIPFDGLNNGSCESVVFSKGKWVAGGSGGNYLYYSTDGKVWYPCISTSALDKYNIPFYSVGCKTIETNENMWVAGCQESSEQPGVIYNTIYYSSDARIWSPCKTPVTTLDPYGILFGGEIGNSMTGPQCRTVVYRNNVWVAGGGRRYDGDVNTLYYSTDPFDLWYPCTGSSYVNDTNGIPFNGIGGGFCECIEYANGIWLFGGSIVSAEITRLYYATTPSGILTPCTTPITSIDTAGFPFRGQTVYNGTGIGPQSITYANNRWVCGGGGDGGDEIFNTAYYSIDGKQWFPCETPITKSDPYGIMFSGISVGPGSEVTSVAYNSGTWVVCGSGPTFKNALYYSKDGKTWLPCTAAAPYSLFKAGITVNHGRLWVTGGSC